MQLWVRWGLVGGWVRPLEGSACGDASVGAAPANAELVPPPYTHSQPSSHPPGPQSMAADIAALSAELAALGVAENGSA